MDKLKNEDVPHRVGARRKILESIMERKRKWLGHWLWQNNLMVETLEGMVSGGKKRRRKISKSENYEEKNYYGMKRQIRNKTDNDGEPTSEDLPMGRILFIYIIN